MSQVELTVSPQEQNTKPAVEDEKEIFMSAELLCFTSENEPPKWKEQVVTENYLKPKKKRIIWSVNEKG